MQPRFVPDLQNPADRLFAAGIETDANVPPLTWDDARTTLNDNPLETTATPALSNQLVAFIDGQNLDDDVTVPLPERSILTHDDAQNAIAPEDGSGPVAMAIFPAPATSMPASSVLADPVAGSAGPHVADVSIGDGDAFGAAVHSDYPIFRAGLTATAPLNSGGFATAALAADPATSASAQVALAAPANPAHETSGPITEASVGAGGAKAAQVQQALDESGLNVNGTGIKVGVLSDSFNDLGGAAADEADGALPSASHIQVLEELASGGTDEGRAMMQIVHDIAPGASLAFYTAFESEQDFANGILALAAAGCKVICDDVSYFDEPFFQNGVVAQAIKTVEAEGVTYVTAAGNNASNGYQAPWTPISGSFDGTYLTDTESFGGKVVQTVTINTEGTNDTVPLILQWNQPYGAATSDLEVLVFHNGILYGEFSNINAGQEPNNPLVDVQLPSGTYQIAIENLSGPNPGLIKEITSGDGFPATISGANTGTVVGHAMAPGATTAGAVSAADTPAFGFNPASESFSSSGAGSELLFADNGTALSSPDVINPVAVSGIDDVATTVSGSLDDFYGTSAASASLAGVAALLLSANRDLTPAQVEQIMEATALPMSDSAVSGAGLVQVDPAVAASEALIRKVIESSGSTSLLQAGENYDLDSISSGTGPELTRGGAAITAGEYGSWTPIGAEQVAGGGYDVAWENTSTGQYTVWSTNSNGNYLSNLIPDVSGNSPALESLETTFHQDLNGDGTIGLAGKAIEAFGSTSLLKVGNNYDLESISSGTGPELQRGSAAITAGEYGSWTPIGAEQVAGGGYDVAWENTSTGQYTVWSTNSNGNYLSNLIPDVSGNSPALESLETTFHQDLNGDGTIGIPNTFSLQYKGFDYVAFYNGAYENSDSLPSLAQTGANSIEATLDYGIDVATSQVVADPNYTDSLTALGNTIAQAESLGLSVMVRPLIDFLNPTEIAPYSVGEWRQDYQPTNVATFFASYQQMIVQEAEVAQANGAQMLSIGAELDQLTGPQYLSYWTHIITAVRAVFSGALTYSASWNTASDVSFWSQLNYEGIDNYVPLSNAPNPTLQDLVNGWLKPATASTNPGAYAVIGNQSPIEYFENLAAESGKPLLFTELGYANDSGAAADPSASGNSPDPTLQAELYQAFFQAWMQSKTSSLAGTYFWEWDPNDNASNVGPNIDSFSPQNSPALNQAIAGFEAVSVPAGTHLTLSDAIGAEGSATIATGASLELAAADSGSVKFGGPTGKLILDHSSTFGGQIFNFTGNGSLSGSDQIDLKDIGFGPGTTVAYTGTSTGGMLTVGDAQHHTANIELAGNYTGSTFSLSSDGSGGTIVIDPAAKQSLAGGTLSFNDPAPTDTQTVTVSPQNGGAGYVGNFTVDAVTTANGQNSAAWHFNFESNPVAATVSQSYEVAVANHHADGTTSTATQPVTVTIAGPGNDAFVFHPGVGEDTIVNATSTDTIELDGFSSVTSNHQLASLLADAQAGVSQSLFQTTHGGHDTSINLGNHDVLTLANIPLGALHASDFIVH